MKNIPRILPLAGVVVGGVIAVNAVAGARSLPTMLSGARAWAETVAKPGDKEAAPAPAAKVAPPVPAAASVAAKPPVCAPSDLDVAKEAGLSPAELRVLQTLGARRGELDQREQDMDVQMQLLAAAEAKLDAKVKALDALKGDIQGLLGQADTQSNAEVDRMVAVFQAMKPKDAAARMSVLSDSVRLPIAAKMKERALSAVLAQMSPSDAKVLTEKLANRFADAKAAAEGAAKTAAAAADATPGAVDKAMADAAPAKPGAKKAAAAPRKAAAAKPAAQPSAQASAAPAAAKPATPPAAEPAKAAANATPAPATPAAPPAPKAG